MNALAMLKQDHDQARKLMAELEGTTARAARTRREGFERLARDLTVHEKLEEEFFHPALKEHGEAREWVLEAVEEHKLVDHIKAQLGDTPYEAEEWLAKFRTMRENVEHHIEEEERELFPRARRLLGSELERMGEQMLERREGLVNDVPLEA